MAESVGGDGLVYFGEEGGAANCFLEDGFVYVVAHGLFGYGVYGERDGGEEVLPHFLFGGVGKFFCQGIREINYAESFFEVLSMNERDDFDLRVKRGDDRVGQDGDAVVFAFSVADNDLMIAEINVFDAQAETFH